MKIIYWILILLLSTVGIQAQSYYYKDFGPFAEAIPSPSDFLGYEIGDYHTRHDQMVDYLEKLSEVSENATLIDYGITHENRRTVLLQISNPDFIKNSERIRQQHLSSIFEGKSVTNHPSIINLGFNVHGNEPSGGEASLLTAYVLVASKHPDIVKFRANAMVFIDPVINPDGRDRHTQWANSHRSDFLNPDPQDSEHNEMWPRGRTNHYWFDLNRDWLLAVHPESQGKLDWYHNWYPNVVTDFHEMGTNSSYFFEPMKDNGSENPIMPKENYTALNDTFASYYQREMDKIGSLYFTKEVFDGTYPGYGSSYPDLQGGLGILFEQASSRGHKQETDYGIMTFAFTIRNQFLNAIATVRAGVNHRSLMHEYQRDFFQSALSNAKKDPIKAYAFPMIEDCNRLKAFLSLMDKHHIKYFQSNQEVSVNQAIIPQGGAVIVPTEQHQYRMVQTLFETYDTYKDSVFYDASAWSLANAYNIPYKGLNINPHSGNKITHTCVSNTSLPESKIGYIIPWDDYLSPAVLYHLQENEINVAAAQKPFRIQTNQGNQSFSYGTLIVPAGKQSIKADELNKLIINATTKYGIPAFSVETGLSTEGIDLGSRYMQYVPMPRVAILIGEGINSYEAGFVWHLFDQRMKMPITKLRIDRFGRFDLNEYNCLVMVSGSYGSLDSTHIDRLDKWVKAGNTLITIGSGSRWAVTHKISSEKLFKPETNTEEARFNYIEASEINGRNAIGGAIFKIDLDITHPIGYGYEDRHLPVYRNNTVFINPSKNNFSNIGLYTEDPHIDGFITDKNLNERLKPSASIVTSRNGRGRVILFAEDPNFRGSWYGTNKLFMNAIFFGPLINTF